MNITKTSGALLGVSLFIFSGCAAPLPTSRPAPPDASATAALPSYEKVVAGYNERVAGVPRLWARTVGRIWTPDEDGRIQTEQVEGHLQYMATSRLLMTFDKVATTYGMLGSNEEKYWWIELDREPRAHVGEHALVTPERIAELGMPIYPRDVIELLGITPLPVHPSSASMAWTGDGRAIVVTTPAPGTQRTEGQIAEEGGTLQRTWIDPESYEPQRIEMLDALGQIRVVSELSRYQQLSVPGGGPEVPRPRVPGEIFVNTADERTQMRLRIYDPEAGSRRPREVAFDLDRLLELRGVREVILVDEPRAAAR